MKRLIAGIFIALTTLTVTAAQLDLRDITDNVFKGETMSQITPLKDGIHYVASNSDNTFSPDTRPRHPATSREFPVPEKYRIIPTSFKKV